MNGLQFYDWQWKHHLPVKGDPANPAAQWADIGGRPISAQVVRSFIDESHRAGMVAMQYNLIYGALDNFERDGVDRRWALFNKPDGGEIWNLPMPPDWDTKAIHLFNPANKGWQDYLFARELDVFRAFDFDGWHADTIGDHGMKYDADGKPVDIKETFKPFLTAAKAAMGSKYLVMNTVGNKGHLGVHTSPVDAIYSEIWEEDGIVDYQQVQDMVIEARQESGGKSIIVPAYVNFDYAETRTDAAPGQFNAPGVLLTEAAVMASGGSRLELGDDTRMLSHPYFPNRHLVMTDDLKRDMRRYMESLALLLDRDDALYWPTHGPSVLDPKRHVEAFIAHRREREEQILACIERGQHKIEDMVPTMYADVPEFMYRAAARSVLSAVVYLVQRGELHCDGPVTLQAEYFRA